jgi:hypothetical protein
MEQYEKPPAPGWYWRHTEEGDEIVYAEKGCKGLLLYRHGDEEPYLPEELAGPYVGPLAKPTWAA